MTAILAGGEAEQAFYGAVRGDGGDREIVRKLVRTSGRDPGYIAMCRRDAAWLVDVHRDRIATVAMTLLEHGALNNEGRIIAMTRPSRDRSLAGRSL